MIFITGDIHGDPRRFGSKYFPEGKNLTKEDYVIILGDFGMLWDQEMSKFELYWLKWLNNKPWTTLFIDGNHENYDRLNSYPKEEWHGGLVQKIMPSIIHLCRGQIFDLEGFKFLALGGANSHDIFDGILELDDPDFKKKYKELSQNPLALFRVNHLSWWADEIPTRAEIAEAYINLEKVDNKVHYVLTHEAPAHCNSMVSAFPPTQFSRDLGELSWKIDYKEWFFGHYHLDGWAGTKETCCYEKIRRIV